MPKNAIPANTFFDAQRTKVEANTFFDAQSGSQYFL